MIIGRLLQWWSFMDVNEKKMKTRICETVVRVATVHDIVRFTWKQDAKQLYFICSALSPLETLKEPLKWSFTVQATVASVTPLCSPSDEAHSHTSTVVIQRIWICQRCGGFSGPCPAGWRASCLRGLAFPEGKVKCPKGKEGTLITREVVHSQG